MPRTKKAVEESKQDHSKGEKHTTKSSGEHKDGKNTLMDGIVRGIPKRNMPPTIDGIVRGVAKYRPSLDNSMLSKAASSATPTPFGSFGSGMFAEGKL